VEQSRSPKASAHPSDAAYVSIRQHTSAYAKQESRGIRASSFGGANSSKLGANWQHLLYKLVYWGLTAS
jgi:hypothetical protein